MTDFFASWPLFFRPYSLTLVAAATLAIVGVVTAARRQVFMAAAVAQASVMGYAAVAFFLGTQIDDMLGGALRDAVVVAAAVLAAVATMLGGPNSQGAEGGRLDGDERTAWLFVAAGAFAVLFLANAPAGMEQVRRLQVSSVIGASWSDLAMFSGLLVALVSGLVLFMKPLILMLSDPVMASAIGLRVSHWNLALAVAAGLCVGLAVRATGMLFAFGALALPVMIAKQYCGEVRSLFLVAPAVGASLAFVGLWLSFAWNLPPGQAAVGVMCVALLVAHLTRRGWDRAAG